MIVISLDSPFVHKVWNDQELSEMVDGGAPFYMAQDPAGRIGEMYGVYDEVECVDVRGTFTMNPEGIVVGYEILTPPVGRSVDEILRQLEAQKLVYDKKGAEVAPTGWKPGKQTLTPGEDLVGQVWKQWKLGD